MSVMAILQGVAERLPAQPPLQAFVHHNTLHAFEDLPFEKAVVEAANYYGTEPFPQESFFGLALRSGRIEPRDIDAIVAKQSLDPLDAAFIRERLRFTIDTPSPASVAWRLGETDLLQAYDREITPERGRELAQQGSPRELLPRLWRALEAAVDPVQAAPSGPRRRDQLLRFGIDTDRWVHPVLMRFCAAYLDQGIAYWSMPDRELGLLGAFRRLYGEPIGPMPRWLSGLAAEVAQQQSEAWSAEATIEWALQQQAYPQEVWPVVIEQVLLSLRGWAGMVHKFEERPDQAPTLSVPARLADYLAVQLLLAWCANTYALREALGAEADWSDLARALRSRDASNDPTPSALVYESFIAAQRTSADLHELCEPGLARIWLRRVERFGSHERRALWQLAYERRHRVIVLDGVLAHQSLVPSRDDASRIQVVFCIDDREESTRRHLEEVLPDVETFGYVGFFGVAMAYQGIGDPKPRPLCPPVVRPRHLVTERWMDDADELAHQKEGRRRGAVRHGVRIGSHTLLRGSALSVMFGAAAALPIVARSLFPGLAERLAPPPRRPRRTRLQLTHDDAIHGASDLHGYTVEEMADVVGRGLDTMGLRPDRCTLVVLVGHGSSSLNNPHAAAYDCGATGGGRGGPNARAFAAMANREDVRAELARRGRPLPQDAWFVGAYHNTCDDAMDYDDDDLIPDAQRANFDEIRRALAAACALDAQERCRRFDSAAPGLAPQSAMSHVQRRAFDLAQPRPECGHATNAVCIVGRRAHTRGLFLDRRAFLVSYDPRLDADGTILAGLLGAVGPVGAGINLEYYFSFVDSQGYGCGSKLPHNIVGLIGVMDGPSSDLRTGLPWQMVELHEPVRLLNIVEASPERLSQILATNASLGRLVTNGWVQMVAWSPEEGTMQVFDGDRFVPYDPEECDLPIVARSSDYFKDTGLFANLKPAHIRQSWRH